MLGEHGVVWFMVVYGFMLMHVDAMFVCMTDSLYANQLEWRKI